MLGVDTIILDIDILENISAIFFNISNNNSKTKKDILNGNMIDKKPSIIIIPIMKLTSILDIKNVIDILLNNNMLNGRIRICAERDTLTISLTFKNNF